MILASQSTASFEALKLHLVQNAPLPVFEGPMFDGLEVVSLEELVEYLIESLEDADKTQSNKAEALLVRIGKPAIPFLLQGLKSLNTNVKSVCAMALIRMGEVVVEDLKEFYIRNASRAKVRWVAEFVLAELSEPLPELSLEEPEALPRKVLELSRAS